MTHQANIEEGNEAGEIHAKWSESIIELIACEVGNEVEWALWFGGLTPRFKRIDCGTAGEAKSIFERLARGKQESLDAMAILYGTTPDDIACWFVPESC